MLLVNFLTFIRKLSYLMYMIFFLIPIAIIYALTVCIWVFIEHIFAKSIHKIK
jgi:hypothetical protein